MSERESEAAPRTEPMTKYIPPGYESAYLDPTPPGDVEPPPTGWISWTALRVTLGRVPLWLIAAAIPMALATIGAMGWYNYFDRVLGSNYAMGEQLGWLTDTFRFDHRSELSQLRNATGQSAAIMAFITFLAGVFVAGGWLQVFLERTEGHSVDRFFHGGVRYFWRFFRVLIGVLLLLGLGHYLIYGKLWNEYIWQGLFDVADGNFENLSSEATARRLTLLQDSTFALWFAGVMVWADYLRTRLAFLGSRSVLWQGFATFFMLLIRPIAALRPMLVLFVFEALVLVGLGWISSSINYGITADSSASSVWTLLGLTIVGILWMAVVNAARYHAAVQVTRVVVEPLGVEDPWENTVGGPGGPRYPVGQQEDFEISI